MKTQYNIQKCWLCCLHFVFHVKLKPEFQGFLPEIFILCNNHTSAMIK